MIGVSTSIDDAIRQTAVDRLGVADTSIVRHVERGGPYGEPGTWYVLSVKLPGDREWILVGRRRTKAELLQLVSTLDPRQLDGKRL